MTALFEYHGQTESRPRRITYCTLSTGVMRLIPGRVAQSVTCLVTDAKLTADPGVASSIPARSHTFVEIDHEIISTVILLPSAESFMKGCCQLQAKVCARLLVNCLFKLVQEKSVVRWTDRPAMTIAVDMGRKATKTNKQTKCAWYPLTQCPWHAIMPWGIIRLIMCYVPGPRITMPP